MAFIASHIRISLTGACSGSFSAGLPATIIDLQQLLSDPSTSWLATTVPSTLPMMSPFPLLSTSSGDPLSPLLLSCIAGASTSLGALVVFLVPPPSSVGDVDDDDDDKRSQLFLERFLSFSLSLAASVMITVSVISILPEALDGILEFQHEESSYGFTILNQHQFLERVFGFGAGCLVYFLLARVLLLLPEPESIVLLEETAASTSNHIDVSLAGAAGSSMTATSLLEESEEQIRRRRRQRSSSWRMALLIFISLLLHNAPEGFAVAISASESNELGLVVTIGIMMHNIPEGLAIAVPCLMAQPDRPWIAFWLASISGLAEPMGALVALQLLQQQQQQQQQYATIDTVAAAGNAMMSSPPLGDLLAAVAGIMCMVSIRDLYPEAQRHLLPSSNHNTNHHSRKAATTTKRDYSTLWWGTVCGMAIMSATEFFLIPR